MRLVLTLLLLATCAESYKILVYNSKFAHSHTTFMGRLADDIAGAGHEVVSLVPIINPDISDFKSNSSTIVVEQAQSTNALVQRWKEARIDHFLNNIFNPIGAYLLGKFMGSLFAAQCRATLEEPGLIERLKAAKYDVILVEHFDMCGLGLVEVVKPTSLISVASTVAFGPQLEEFGIPYAPNINPCLPMLGCSVDYHTNLASIMSVMNGNSISDRLWNLYSHWLVRMQFSFLRSHVRTVFEENYGSNFPSFTDISSQSAYVFTNSEPLIDFATPTISKVISIGGLGTALSKKLSQDWEDILTRREKTVLISFGTFAKSSNLPIKLKFSILETIKAFPNITFIWKYEIDDEFTIQYASKAFVANLCISKWTPQVDLLAHPKMAAFITHGGAGSTHETARRGVPGIFVPLFGDQPRNAGMMQHNGLGKVMSKYDVANPIKFIATIKEVLEKDSYRTRARKVAEMLRKKPFHIDDLVVKHVEFAAEFGPSFALRPQSFEMSWIEYHNVDIFAVGLGVMFIVGLVFVKLVLRLSRVQENSKKKWE